MSGIVGVVSGEDCKDDIFYMTDYHSHLGTKFGGLVLSDDEKLVEPRIHSIETAPFRTKFIEDRKFREMHGNKAIGVISDCDAQPLVMGLKFGQYALCGAGFVDNCGELSEKLRSQGVVFSHTSERGEINQIELVGNLINQGADLEDGVDFMFNQIRGSMSLLLLGKEGLYAVRDKYGRTPLALARRKRGSARCVVSETCSFKNLEFAIERFLGPGEMILLTEGKEQQIKSSGLASQLCTFLYVYTGNPAAEYHGVSVKDFRLRSGRVMAKRDKKEGISGHYVAGIPDSGSDYAKGHSNESHTALEEPIVKYTATWQRSYMPPDQKTRDEIALYKLIIIDSLIRGRVGILTEDSIVRGTQLRKLLKNKVLPANPKEIHMRPACPPLLFNCPYLLSTRTLDELFARRVIKSVTGEDLRDVEPYLDQNSREFRRFLDAATRKLGVTTLRYQELGDMIRETRQPENSLCTSCWTGRAIPSN